MKKIIKISSLSYILAGFFVLTSGQTHAGTVTGAIKANATLSSFCTISATNINFGTLRPSLTASTQISTNTVTSMCSKGVPYKMALSPGNVATLPGGENDVIHARKLVGITPGNTDTLSYSVCTNGAIPCNQQWGDSGQNSTIAPINLVGTGSPQTTTGYGVIAASTYVTPDIYTDTLTLTVSY